MNQRGRVTKGKLEGRCNSDLCAKDSRHLTRDVTVRVFGTGTGAHGYDIVWKYFLGEEIFWWRTRGSRGSVTVSGRSTLLPT